MTAKPIMCAECGRAPARPNRKTCLNCIEAFAQRCGVPPEGRDPAEVRHELTCRRGAALLLHGRLTGRPGDETAGMTVVLAECHVRPGLTPAAALVDPLLNLAGLVVDGYLGGELVSTWRTQFVERLAVAGGIAAAEAEITADADLARDCRATEAAEIVLRGRLTRDVELEARGWALADDAAGRSDATPPGVLLGPILGLVNDNLRGVARDRFVEALRKVLMMWAPPTPDNVEGLM
ncbi:hypothetical protein I546_4170 [Mycobacterium kansasii 732]|nr:hypothetical protein I546_4170 [Mycobacterium kansasii 732]